MHGPGGGARYRPVQTLLLHVMPLSKTKNRQVLTIAL